MNILSIDHGNKYIKSEHFKFISGLTESEQKPLFENDTILYNNKYYSLSNERIPVMRDKTKDERFYILTLIAVAKELEKQKKLHTHEENKITLLVGLPPMHYPNQHEGFENYFMKNNGKVEFIYKDKQIKLSLDKAICFPQAYAAYLTRMNELKEYKNIVIVDIGGYTADYVAVNQGIPDFDICDSLNEGIITMYNAVASKINSEKSIILREDDIDFAVMKRYETYFPNLDLTQKILIEKDIQDLICKEAEIFTYDFIRKLQERKIELKNNLFLFVGGGAFLLQPFIKNQREIPHKVFIEDTHANVKGYLINYQAVFGSDENA